jgi:hypothetical protein
MIFLYGDSHVSSFKGLDLPHVNLQCSSITMFRIGRDNHIIHFDSSHHDSNSVLCFVYGEVDCRCHIQRQVNIGRSEHEVIRELVEKYFQTLSNSIKAHSKVFVVGVIPPTAQGDYESINGPILHEFPFVGSDADRVRFTNKVNECIKKRCSENGYIYFNPYPDFYTRPDGTFKYEFSDNTVHLRENSQFLKSFKDVLSKS